MKKYPPINKNVGGTEIPKNKQLRKLYDSRAKEFWFERSVKHYYDVSYQVLCKVYSHGMSRWYLGSYNYAPDLWYYTEFGENELITNLPPPREWIGIADEFTGEDTGDPDYHSKRMEQKYFTDLDVEKMVDEYFDSFTDVNKYDNPVGQNTFKSGALFLNDHYKKNMKT